jgi:hypothetical protein
VFEDSPIGLDKWLSAVWLVVNCKNGISSWESHRDLKVTQKSAWFMLGRIRLALQNNSFEKLGGDGGEVEADETFVGGKHKNMHKERRIKIQRLRSERTRGTLPGKTAVMGMLDREARQVRTHVIPNVRRDTLQTAILNEVITAQSSTPIRRSGYQGSAVKYAHEVVNHMEKYVDGRVHTNGLENFWSLFKRTLNGYLRCCRAVPPVPLRRTGATKIRK